MQDDTKILIDRNGRRMGPYTFTQVNGLLTSGNLVPEDMAWIEGTQNWVQLRALPGVIYIPQPPKIGSEKRILPVFLLAFFVGVFGVHRFYVGKTGTGIIMLVLTLTLIGAIISAIWAMVDWIMAVCGAFTDAQGNKITQWT